jgi:hypothetical protein
MYTIDILALGIDSRIPGLIIFSEHFFAITCQGDGMKCPSCSSTLEIEDRFCSQCGAMRPILPERFARAEGEFTRLRASFLSGELDRIAFITAVKDMTIQDKEGAFWCLGVQSGQWFRYENTSWVQTDPPLQTDG